MTQRLDDAVPSVQRHRALVVVAAGSGTRLGLGIPKAAVELNGRTLLENACGAATADLNCDLLVLVLPAEDDAHHQLAEAAARVIATCETAAVSVRGGTTRTESVAAGVAAVTDAAEPHLWDPNTVDVLIHDAARALTPTAVFERVFAALECGAEAVVPAVAVADTIKQVDPGGQVSQTLRRDHLRAVQTPQGFTLDLMQRVAEYLDRHPDQAAQLTDEAMIAEHLEVAVSTVEGDPRALKITTPTDLSLAEVLAADPINLPGRNSGNSANLGPSSPSFVPGSGLSGPAPSDFTRSGGADSRFPAPRVGIGQDIHAFAPQDQPTPLQLAGLYWPGQQGLTGHSDGDVVAHACCDALFSAAGIGDLGAHFGTERPDLEGASGTTLLREAAQIVRQAGFTLGSIAVQFVGNRPTFGPRRDEAQWVLSEAAGAPVAISATTSDGLGFTGRSEGLTATATAVLIPGG